MTPTVNSYEEFLDLRDYSSNTKKLYLGLKNHVSEEPTQEEVNRFLIEKPYGVARAFIKSYVKDYLKKHDIYFERVRGRQRKILQSERVLEEAEYNKLISSLPLRESLICRFLKEAAMRQNEVLNLTLDNIDFDENKIVWFGKGNKECSGYISSETKDLFVKFINQSRVGFGLPVFGIKRSRFWQILTKFSHEILGKHVTSHWMKRTCGRWLEDQGYTLEERQYYLKHAKSTTTQENYSFKKGRDVMKKIKIILE